MDQKLTGMDALRAECENIAELARQLGITRGAIPQWTRIPADRVVDIERFTGISRERLRPDLYTSAESAGQVAQ